MVQDWGTVACTRRKNGLQCVSACTDCRGQHCENQSVDINLVDVDKERNIFDLFQDLWDVNDDYW